MKIDNFNLDFNHELYFNREVTSIEGLTEINTSFVYNEYTKGDGVVIGGSHKPGRPINIETTATNKEADFLISYFAAGSIHVLYLGDRKIDVVCEQAKITRGDNNGLHYKPVFNLQLFAPDPWFSDIDNFGKNLAGRAPGLSFPWESTVKDGFTTGYMIFDEMSVFHNSGNTSVGFEVIFTAEKGEVINPKFEHLVTGDFIEVNTTLSQGESLVISTVRNQKYITLNGANVFDRINRLSTFFELSVGDNLLKFSAESGVSNLAVMLFYTPKYANGLVVET